MSVVNNVKALISTSKLTNLANAIRNKTGEVKSYTIDEMIEKINEMGSSVLTSLNVTTNGIYTPPSGFDGFNNINVNVPNNLVLIDTVEVNGVNGIQTNIDMSWFDTYDYIIFVPDLIFSTSDWAYITQDSTTGGDYSAKVSSLGLHNNVILNPLQGQLWFCWFREHSSRPLLGTVVSYLYWYLYGANNTMTGTIKIYGIKLT